MRLPIFFSFVALLGHVMSMPCIAAEADEQLDTSIYKDLSSNADTQNSIVSYPHAYFVRFQPLTALDMVRQVPGFRLENNNSTRGYSDALGNLLINDRRPSAKQDQPLDILSRIPADLVERIELIRGQIREIDLQGQSNLINIILREDSGASVKWEAYIRKTFGHGSVTPAGNVSISNTWAGVDYNVGIGGRQSRVGRKGLDDIFDVNNDFRERRVELRNNKNTFYKANFNASTWIGETFLQVNTNLSQAEHFGAFRSQRVDQDTRRLSSVQFVDRNSDEPFFETGFDMQRNLHSDLIGKYIFLFYRGFDDGIETQRIVDGAGNQTLLRTADTYKVATEVISRFEFDWSGFTDHAIQINLEGAYNLLEGKFTQTDDRGTGPIEVNIPGANSTVKEVRGDFLVKDTWSLGPYELEFGLAAEVSRLTQRGDVDQQRNFFFVKPQGQLTYSNNTASQTRLRLAREVSQLDLQDFISATVFEDDDLALGNPDIRPYRTWVAEFSHERRFGRESVIKLTAFHHWITDVLDLLPLTNSFEVPGNIGNGRRWGLLLEGTLPLQRLGLNGARLKLKTRWQDSTVVDPLTEQNRVLSEINNPNAPDFFNVENKYVYSLDFRQDFEASRVAWGWVLQERAEQLKYKVNEFEINDEGTSLDAFIETTRWFGIRTNLFFENILDIIETRERTSFEEERGLSPVGSRTLRTRHQGIRIFLTFSGTF